MLEAVDPVVRGCLTAATLIILAAALLLRLT